MRGLSIEIDGRGIQSLVDVFGATEDQVNAAMRSTYSRMGRWLRTRALRGLTGKLAIQQKILRGRVKAFRFQGGAGSKGEGAKVWFGLRDVSLMRLNAREAAGGVKASGGRFIKGAFIARFQGRMQVLKREGKGRLPIHVVAAEISEPAQIYIEDELIGSAEFDLQFFRFLEHELKWRTRILK